MIKWIKQAWQTHREWGWVADMDEHGNLRPANPKRRARLAARLAREGK